MKLGIRGGLLASGVLAAIVAAALALHRDHLPPAPVQRLANHSNDVVANSTGWSGW